jgi:anti-sigma28 factor (negative regulator of flagellin synthesis)
MAFTGRHTSRKVAPGKRGISETQTGEQIARAVRVEELRRLVASGRYQVEPQKLAMSMLARALREQDDS